MNEEILGSNPADGIKKVKEDIHIKTFTDDEVRQILSHLRRTTPGGPDEDLLLFLPSRDSVDLFEVPSG